MRNKTGYSFLFSMLFIILIISCGEKSDVKNPGNKNNQPANAQNSQNGTNGNQEAINMKNDGSVDIKLNLKKGQKIDMKVVNSQKVSQTMAGQKQEMSQKAEQNYSFTVQDIDASGNAMIKVVNVSLIQEAITPNGTIKYDSRDIASANNPMFKMLSNIIGKEFYILISPAGKIIKVTGMEKIISNIIKSAELPKEANPKDLEQQLNLQFGNDRMKEQMEKGFNFIPDKPVKIGDSWSNVSNEITMDMPILVENTWKLKEVKNGEALIEVNSVEKFSAQNKQIGNVKYDISGSQKGMIGLDEATGWIKNKKIDKKAKGKIVIPKNPQMPDGMTIPIEIVGYITVESQIK